MWHMVHCVLSMNCSSQPQVLWIHMPCAGIDPPLLYSDPILPYPVHANLLWRHKFHGKHFPVLISKVPTPYRLQYIAHKSHCIDQPGGDPIAVLHIPSKSPSQHKLPPLRTRSSNNNKKVLASSGRTHHHFVPAFFIAGTLLL